MLNSLKFEATFSSTGKTFNGDHKFENGMTAITGPNEAGKSLRFEMIRFSLFGSKALRSDLKQYEKLSCELSFKVGESNYTLTRTLKTAKLLKEGTPVAIDTKPVNNYIVNLLGYDLSVFDVSNAVLQGQVEDLGNKTPAERKKMIDQTLGLNAIDAMITNVSEDLNGLRKSKDVLAKLIPENPLVEPVKPQLAVYDTDEILKRISVLREDKSKHDKIITKLELLKCSEPNVPQHVEVRDLAVIQSELVSTLSKRDNVESNRKLYLKWKKANDELMALGERTPQIKHYIDEQLDLAWEHFNASLKEYQFYLSKTEKKPYFEEEDLEFIRKGLGLKAQIEKLHKVNCPNCQHEFNIEGVSLEEFDWNKFESHYPELQSYTALSSASGWMSRYKAFLELPAAIEPVKPTVEYISKQEILNYQNILKDLTTFDEYKDFKEIDYNSEIKRLEEERAAALEYQKQLDIYTDRLVRFRNYEIAKDEAEPFLSTYSPVTVEMIEAHEQDLALLRQYNLELAVWKSRNDEIDKHKKELESIENEIKILQSVRKSLTELKPRVTSYLLPSLMSASSSLLEKMTNGTRNKIDISQGFDIKVDNQPIDTLSGSAKAVANLALRIGLGMVLTNKVFSVLLADEVDAAMDDERAQNTAECLRNLNTTIKQIILVSHQKPEADHHITLKA